MIEIKITDPHHTLDKEILRKTANYLLSLIEEDVPKPLDPPIPIPLPPTPPPLPPAAINPFAAQSPLEPINTYTEGVQIKFGVETDSNGMPWDGRIHSRSKSKTADGAWRYMRGVPEETVLRVESELKQALAAPVIKEVYEKPIEKGGFVPPPPAPEETYDPVNVPSKDFPMFMDIVSSAVAKKKIDTADVINLVREFGIPSIPVVATRPDAIPAIIDRLNAMLAGIAV